MNLRELKLLNSKTCCGYEFTANDITKIEINKDYKFYGGRVQYYTITKCPKCHKEVVLLLEAYDNSYRVIDIAIAKEITESKAIKRIEEISKEWKGKDITGTVEMSAKDEELAEVISEAIKEKFICPNCNREFKTKAGLGKHIKSCK